ncbi:MAG TPA: xanthine dehydrogenase family protein molybdopterin-binding subunit [Geminicoccaceae bacterium]|nr:xanthine dehydrogenase family protein molybdopterin-binding subunit [Geminicoccaceae bacterium]
MQSPDVLPQQKFGIGQPVARKQDPRLVAGRGRYADDVNLAGQAFMAVLRSPVAHGVLRPIETSAALAAPDVLAVYTAEDFASAGYGPLQCKLPLMSHDGSALFAPPRPLLASGRVRYVGEPVAFVVAISAAAARDGAERIELAIEPLPAVTEVEEALEGDAPRLFENHANLCLDWRFGDFAAVERAFADAAHVTRLRLINNRVVVAALEPRAAVAAYDAASGRFELHVGCQGVFGLRRALAEDLLKIEPGRLRVLSHDIGGSFGMKAAPYPEYVGLLHAARALGRPVKWCDERSGSFLSDQQGRATVMEGELALDAEGNFLAVRVQAIGNMGAYLTAFGPAMPSVNMQKNLPSLYRTPAIAIRTRCAFTNTVPIGPYRGAGRPEANYCMERLIDAAARETGRDPAALRRRNLIPAGAMPYTAPSGLVYDSGDFAAVLDAGLAKADWTGFTERRRASEARGRLRGRGLACYLEVTAPPNPEMGGIRFEEDGRITVITGTLDYGQGHASAFAQVLVSRLGLPFERIDLVQGDSDQLLAGGGTGGSRSIMASGKALAEAAAEVIAKGRALAGHFLEAAPADIGFEAGEFRITGTDRAIALLELAAAVRAAGSLPEGLPASLDVALVTDGPPSAFPNGCHVCEVEIDPETGQVELRRYVAVDDFGTLINPMLAEGQVHGGVAQGIGQALLERAVYDGQGQLLSGSFMDYALPRADGVPALEVGFHPVPATSNPLGVKGCGEAGVTGALPAVMNAVLDALSARGVTRLDMPATPARVWAALRAAAGCASA